MRTHINELYKNIYSIRKKYIDNKRKILKPDKITLQVWDILDKYAILTKYEKEEVVNPINDNIYKILVADNDILIKLFSIYLVVFENRAVIRAKNYENHIKKVHVGIDFEFNNRNIALMQICFEDIGKCYIWLVNPSEFNTKQKQILINTLLVNKYIYKILHGPESLDLPYLYDILLGGDQKTILKFSSKLFDTRYLCEYYKISIDDLEAKCSIYNALYYFNTINKKKLKYLEDGHNKMGKIQNVSWDIHNLNKYYIEYALYDVLYLQNHLFDIYKIISDTTPENVNTYKYITSVMRYVFNERRSVTNISEMAKKITDPLNNYIAKDINVPDQERTTLLSIYEYVTNKLHIRKGDVNISFILSVGYFKKTLTPLLKHIVFYKTMETYKVYETTDIRTKNKLNNDKIFENLNKYNYKMVHKLLGIFEDYIQKRIDRLYRSK